MSSASGDHTPHLFADVLARVHGVCRALTAEGALPEGLDLSRIVVEPPRDASHGDMATNAATTISPTHQSHSKVLGISTGPFSGRISSEFVPLGWAGNKSALLLLAMPQTFLSSLEKSRQRAGIRFSCPQLNRVYPRAGE